MYTLYWSVEAYICVRCRRIDAVVACTLDLPETAAVPLKAHHIAELKVSIELVDTVHRVISCTVK